MSENKENWAEDWTEEEKKQGFKIIPMLSNYDLEDQIKAFGIEMDRIEEAYRKFVEENLDSVHETTEYADKRIKKLEERIGELESLRQTDIEKFVELEKNFDNHSHPHSHKRGYE